MNFLLNLCAVAVLMTATPANMTSIATSYTQVQDAKCVCYNDVVVLALKSEPIFFRSDRQALISNIQKEIKSSYDVSDIYVSLDKDIYYKISKIETLKVNGVNDKEINKEIVKLLDIVRQRDKKI